MPYSRLSAVGDYRPLHINATKASATPIGAQVNTTSTTTITAGSDVVVTPASMANITPGMYLNFANGTGTAESVQVKRVDYGGGTFTADFTQNHSGAYTIISTRGTYLGTLLVGAAGTGVSLTLYNGHPSLLPDAGQVVAVITPVAPGYAINEYFDRGAWYELSGTPGDYTIGYIDAGV